MKRTIITISLSEREMMGVNRLLEKKNLERATSLFRYLLIRELEGLEGERVFKKGIAEKKVELKRDIIGLADDELISFLIKQRLIPNVSMEKPDANGTWYEMSEGSICLFSKLSDETPAIMDKWTREQYIEKLETEERI